MRDFHKPGRSAVYATSGMCATSHPLAAKVAVQMMEAGGNAMDGAIAGAVLLGLCEPQMTGIGGDCFVLMTPPGEDRVVALNGSGRAPAGIDAEKLRAKGDTIALFSADAVTVPGAVDAFCKLSKDWGKLGLKAVLAPSIHYAEEGIPVAERVSSDWGQSTENLSGAARDYFLLNGQAPRPGQLFRAPQQAEVLRRVAMEGRAGFSEGEVADDIVSSLQAVGGTHTLDDFANTESDYTDPIVGGDGGLDLFEHPPNGQGATAILLLNMLKHFDIAGMDPWGSERAHIEAEATKLAYDVRNKFMADPDYMNRLDYMTSPETAEKLAALIDPTRAMPAGMSGVEAPHKDTIYITVVDKDRMCVSLNFSIFKDFGSGIASDKLGVLLQNRGAGFTI